MSDTPIVQPIPEGISQSVADRFWTKVHKQPDGCWLWTGTKTYDGYPKFYLKGRMARAHRVAYELTKGPIPSGLQIDHLCKVTCCVNPEHLEAVTCRENLLRGDGFIGRQARQTHCQHGHPFNEANTYVNKKGHRRCRTCHRNDMRNRRKAAHHG